MLSSILLNFNLFANRTNITSKISKNGIGKMIVSKLSPSALRIKNPGNEISKGINSLIIPTNKKRNLWNFPINKRQISIIKINLKKINSKWYSNALKYLIVYQDGSKEISHIIDTRLFGPGPKSI
jgi:hypothetical protein